jgi:hypothetical protein
MYAEHPKKKKTPKLTSPNQDSSPNPISKRHPSECSSSELRKMEKKEEKCKSKEELGV